MTNPRTELLSNRASPLIESEFRAMYMVALENGLASVGKHLSRVAVDFITRKYGIAPNETYRSPAFLSESLKKILGSMGAVLVETRILASLYSQMEIASPIPSVRAGHPEDFEKSLTELVGIITY